MGSTNHFFYFWSVFGHFRAGDDQLCDCEGVGSDLLVVDDFFLF